MKNIKLDETKYEKLVYSNHYGELLETVATDLGFTPYARMFNAINVIHETEGHINDDVLQLRTRIKDDFKKYLFSFLTEDQYAIVSKYI